MKAVLAILETVLAVVVAAVLGFVSFQIVMIALWIGVEGRPLAESPLILNTYRAPLDLPGPDDGVLERLEAAVETLGVAQHVSVREPDSGPVLVVVGVRSTDIDVVRQALEEHGFSPDRLTRETGVPLVVPDLENPSTTEIAALLGTQALGFTAVAVVLVWWRIRRSPLVAGSSLTVTVLMGIGAGVVAVVASAIITGLMSLLGIEVQEQPWLIALAAENPAGLLKLAPWIVLAAPISEEVFFRAYAFRFLSSRCGFWVGAVASSLLFAGVHGHPPLIPVYMVYGMMFAWLLHRTSRVAAPVVAHVTVNLVGVLLLLISAGKDAV